jgi:hypothetical protein
MQPFQHLFYPFYSYELLIQIQICPIKKIIKTQTMKNNLFLLAFLFFTNISFAQVAVNTTGASAASSAILDVSSNTKGFLPPRMTEVQRNAIVSPDEGLMIYNTTTKKPNYYNGSEWKNFEDSSIPSTIGASYGGGVIAYFLLPGDPGYVAGQTHGLIAAASDQSTGVQWGCEFTGIEITGADGTTLGTGYQNTIDIIDGCATAGIAAKLCSNLLLNGFNDWYLPSRDELNKLYLNQTLIGGFVNNGKYWSSSEAQSNASRIQYFIDGIQSINQKSTTNRVRAVRSF